MTLLRQLEYGSLGIFLLWLLAGVRFIANDRIGIIEKLWSRKGSVKKGLIALEGEAGFEPAVLRGGRCFIRPGADIFTRPGRVAGLSAPTRTAISQ